MDQDTQNKQNQSMPPPLPGSPADEVPPYEREEYEEGYEQSSQEQPKIPPEEMLRLGFAEIHERIASFLFFFVFLADEIMHLVKRISIRTPASKKGIAISIAGFLVFILVGFLVFASVATYTTAPLPISTSQRNGLKVFLYYLPFFPKTPEQILLVAIDKNAKVLTATPDFSLSAQINSTGVSVASLNLRVNGPADFSPDKTFATNVSVDASASLGSSNFAVSGNVIQKDGVTFFKITKLPDYLIGLLTSQNADAYGSGQIPQVEKEQIKKREEQVFAKWIVYDDNTFQSQARDNLEQNNQSFITEAQTNIQNFFLKTNTLPEVKRAPDEVLNGVGTYHLTLNPSQKLIKEILLSYIPSQSDQSTYVTNPSQDFSNLANSISNVQIDMWIGKNDSIVRKLSLKSDVDLGFLQQSSSLPIDLLGLSSITQAVNPKLSVATVLIANDINNPVSITKPSPTVSADEYLKELTQASETSEQQAMDKKIALFTKDALTIRYLLSEYYVLHNSFPATLTDLASLTQPNNPIIKKMSAYQYKRSPDGSNYVVYAQFSNDIPNLTYYTPYYGFTSTSPDVHQLLLSEFQDVNSNTTNTSFPNLSLPGF